MTSVFFRRLGMVDDPIWYFLKTSSSVVLLKWALIFFSFLLCVGVCMCMCAWVCLHVCRGYKPILGAVHLGLLRQSLPGTWNSPVMLVVSQLSGLLCPSSAPGLWAQGGGVEKGLLCLLSGTFPGCGLKGFISSWLHCFTHCLTLSRKSCLQQISLFLLNLPPTVSGKRIDLWCSVVSRLYHVDADLPHWDPSLRVTQIYSPGLWSP